MFNFNRSSFFAFVSILIVLNFILLGSLFFDLASRLPASPVVEENNVVEQVYVSDDSIDMTVIVNTPVFVGAPFGYSVRINYNPELVRPDFRRLLREVHFNPFEQLHLSRPIIQELEISSDTQEYLLSYPILGINIIPHTEYSLDTVVLHYQDLRTGENKRLTAQPASINISGYHPEEYLTAEFLPLKGKVQSYDFLKKIAISIDSIIFFISGVLLIYYSSKRRPIQVYSRADEIRNEIKTTDSRTGSTRQRVFYHEKLYLSLISYYRSISARNFWQGRVPAKEPSWVNTSNQMKYAFQTAYDHKPISEDIAESIQDGFTRTFHELEMESEKEKIDKIESIQGSLKQRIMRYPGLFISGLVCLVFTAFFISLLIRPSIWQNSDLVYFNQWIDSLPDKFFDENNINLGTVDIEILGNISEQQNVLINLQGEYFKAAYLYNYGTIISKTIVTIMQEGGESEEGAIEEEEIIEPPSFEFPVQLLANSVRFFPYDSDARKNLELAIMYLINEEDEESGEVQGEIGPPLPGFSRDMNEIQF